MNTDGFMANKRPLLAVGLITCQRPKMLARALESVATLRVPEGVDVQLLLVDNNADGSARPVFDAALQTLPFTGHYVKEPRQGIPFARNRVLDEAVALGADYLAFFDDDSVVEEGWLVHLHSALLTYKANAAHGALRFNYPAGAPAWARARGIFEVNVGLETGAQLTNGPTSNILYDLAFLTRHGLRFDERYALSGGTDLFISTDILKHGGTIVFVKEAITVETLSANRMRLGWMLKRTYRYACNRVIDRRRAFGRTAAAVYAFKMVPVCAFKAVCALVVYPFQRKSITLVYGLRHAVWLAGTLVGLAGGRYNEYRAISGE